MNNLPELSYDEARILVKLSAERTIGATSFQEPSQHVGCLEWTLTCILRLSRDKKTSDKEFRNSVESVINPFRITPDPEAGITLPRGSVQEAPNAIDPCEGWRLLEEGEPLLPGDRFLDPHSKGLWVSYECRPAIFKGRGKEGYYGFCPKNDTAHTWPWRRKIDHPANDAHNVAAAVVCANVARRGGCHRSEGGVVTAQSERSFSIPSQVIAEALWKTMREHEMSMEDALDVCAMIMMGVAKYAPCSNEELVFRIEDKLSKLNPEE